MENVLNLILLTALVGQWLALTRSSARTEQRLVDLQVRFEKLARHVGFVPDADPTPLVTDDVRMLARTPGSKIAAIKLYRQQTGAGLKEAKDAVERMERS